MNYCTSHCYFQVYIRIILTTTTDKELKMYPRKFPSRTFKQLDLFVNNLLLVEIISSDLWYIWWPKL